MNTTSHADCSGGVACLLSDDALKAYRAVYDYKEIADAATGAIVTDLPESKAYVDAIHDSLFVPGPDAGPSLSELSGREREIGLIVLLASQRAALELAIHIYWGLMEDISPHEIAGLMMLTGVYAGIGLQTTGMKLLQSVLTALQQRYEESLEMSEEDRDKHLATVPVLYALAGAFS
jgi:alkylhydroperoxidase/carboxymuconolactone decarboxylase family protein YurZ